MTEGETRLVVLASARRILAVANTIRNANLRHDLTVEAAVIITLCEAAMAGNHD